MLVAAISFFIWYRSAIFEYVLVCLYGLYSVMAAHYIMLFLCLQQSEYGLYVLIAVTFSLFGGILYLVCQESRQAADAEKKDN